MNNSETIIIGVVSGVLTSAFLYIAIQIFNKIILPWYRGVIYSGVNIEGQWIEEHDFGNGNQQSATFRLIQKANSISGSVTVVKSSKGQVTQTDIMNLKGSLKDRLLNVTVTPADSKRLGIGTFLHEITGDATSMEGAVCWYDSGNGSIVSKESTWTRK